MNAEERGDTAVFSGKDTMKQECVTQVMLVYSHGSMEVLLFNRIFNPCSMTRQRPLICNRK